MGCFGSKYLSNKYFLKAHTGYEETTPPEYDLITWKEFAVTGKMDYKIIMFIEIEGFGQLTFPIVPGKIIETLKPFMVKSDYSENLGTKRIYDESVRLSSEVPSSRLKFANPDWEKYTKDTLLPKIGGKLGFEHMTTYADLQKLLIYEKGSFFSTHSDRERAPGHFGTLIIQLPSLYSGGQLKCSYGRLQKNFDHSTHDKITHDYNDSIEIEFEQSSMDTIGNKNVDSDMSLSFAGNELCGFYTAFYLGVEHEIERVTSGIRACLVYSLIDTSVPQKILNPQIPHRFSYSSTLVRLKTYEDRLTRFS